VATDKVNSEIPSPVSGILKRIKVQPDQELGVGDTMAVVSTGEAGSPAAPNKEDGQTQAASIPAQMQDYYSPAILRIARENGVSFGELSNIQGRGGGGRVSKKDLEAYICSRKAPYPLKQPAEQPKTLQGAEIEHIKMTGMRKAIADNMVRSFYEAPHATLVAEVDVTDAMKTIKAEREAFCRKHDAKLTISAFVSRAIARALSEYPLLNASLEGDTIVVKKFVNLGIAVSVDQGIVVPVIRGCQTLSLPQIAKQIQEFAKKAREGILSPDDLKEGTATMTNFGMSGVLIGVPIIRYPEVAIIGVGGITRRVVALEDDLFGVRQIMHLSLTFDHRVIDGMYGCSFLVAVKQHLESDLKIES
jgi:2-oxoglutarate dehydrogenase E2 component (dihydrolipoamide succinyltransferase)